MNTGTAILVTGGAGYIGSHTCKALAKAGYTPITYDNLVYGHVEAVKWGPFVEGDLSNSERLEQTLRQFNVRGVVHFAAYCYVGESMSAPEKYFQNNVVNTLGLLEAMRAAGVSDIVFSSTCATYGMPVRSPIDEAHPQNPVNPYGESKLFVEKMLRWYESAYGLHSIALRYFNAAGADVDGEIGEMHEPETHLIPNAILAALGARTHLDLYGSDYPTADGTAIRDYIHVGDLAAAHVAALGALQKGAGSDALNLGTGIGHSVRGVVKMVERVSGRAVPVRELGRRPGDPAELVAAAGRAAQVLGWVPTQSSLQQIIESAWRWHSSAHTAFSNERS